MNKHEQNKGVPQHLLPEYDDYVDDALDLVNGKLSPGEEKAMRKRMAEDPIYKAVIDDIVDAEAAPELPPAVVEASLKRFWEKAGVEPVVGDISGPVTLELEDFAERTRVREHVWRRRLLKVGAVAATVVGLMIGSWFYLDTYWTEHRTPAFATMTLDLPDRSTVLLGPSSALRHLDNMQSGKGYLRRDVYLKGSAEFTVRHLGDVRFSVTSSNASIVAIGTRFHVQTGEALTVVRVDEGRVTVQPVDDMGDTQGEAVAVDAGSTARVVGTKVMIDPTPGVKTP